MAKIYSYTVMLIGLLAVLTVGGIGFTSNLLGALNFSHPENWGSSAFLLTIMGIIVAASGVGIAASFFGRSPSESYVIGVATLFGSGGLLLTAIVEFGSIVILVNNTGMTWLGTILSVVFISIVAGYTIALVQFWRGNDI